jgi:hypothetical protein
MKLALSAVAALLLASAPVAPVYAAPTTTGTIHIHGGSVGFIVGVGGASGYVMYKGKKYDISVGGLKAGTIGASSYDIDGTVSNLHQISDVEGTYSMAEASGTAVVGGGALDLTNGKGVEIKASSKTAGLQLTLGGGGVNISLKH